MRTVFSYVLSARRLALAVVFLAVLGLPVMADEFIRFFSSDLTLLEDGTVDVTEIIEVNAESKQIRRGIFRDIPTVLHNDDGSKLHSELTVLQVMRGGEVEPWFQRSVGDFERVYIGAEEIFLPNGTYRYTIRYTMTRMARRFDDHDEIYWNATGNYWDFPILSAVSTVNLPAGAVAGSMAGYTGEVGSTRSNLEVTRVSDTQVSFRAKSVLLPGEGMSVAVGFQKGVLLEPDTTTAILNYLSDNREFVVPAGAVLLVLFYYLFSWNKVGRDPKKGTIIPLFHPPTGYSPALVHYVGNMGWKGSAWRVFTAAIINLAVKGLINIEKVGKRTKMTTTGKTSGGQLPTGEAVIFNYLNARGSVTINKTTGPGLRTNQHEFISAIETENRQIYFHNNYYYAVAGVALSVVCIAVLLISGVLAFEWLMASIFIGGMLVVLITLTRQIWTSSGFARFFQFAFFGFFLVNFIGGFGVRFGSFADWGLDFNMPAIAAITIIAINVLFAILMRAPTLQGQRAMDQIDGFRMYMETAEKERLNLIGEPKMTTGRFEAILPYAIALGVEKPWSEHFEGELSRSAVADATPGYAPHWYHGSSLSKSGIGADMAALGTGMSTAMRAAQPVSSSSSGSSGGGSSGGGGGGGGGGGW